MEFGIVDYAWVAALAVLILWDNIDNKRIQARVARGQANARLQGYRHTIIGEWAVAVGITLTWFYSGRDFASIGLGLEARTGFWIGAAATVVVGALLIWQTVSVVRSEEEMEKMRDEVGSLASMVPHDEREARWWIGLSVTAGICEELIFRGFLITLLAATVGLWLAVALSALAFGIAHSYQGTRGVIKVAFIGLAAGGLFVLTGSLWLPMLLHVLVDITSGHMARRALESATNRTAPSAA